jgi:hypothetical protein
VPHTQTSSETVSPGLGLLRLSTVLLLAGYGTVKENPSAGGTSHRMENLGRGVVAVNQGSGSGKTWTSIFLLIFSWHFP